MKTFDLEILTEYKGEPVNDDMIIIRVFTDTDTCHVLFAPNMADKKVGLALDQTTEFSDSVLEYLINSGEAQKIMKTIYDKIWPTQIEGSLDIKDIDPDYTLNLDIN